MQSRMNVLSFLVLFVTLPELILELVSGWRSLTHLLPFIIESVSLVSCYANSENVYAQEGFNIELKCPFLSTSTPIIWQNTDGILFDGRNIVTKLKDQNKIKITGNYSIGEYNLIVLNVTKSDVGNFVCGTYFGNETHQHRVSVHLAVPISNLTILRSDNGFLHGTTGTEMSIVCSVQGGIPLGNISLQLDFNNNIVINTHERYLNFTFVPTENMHMVTVSCRGYDILLKSAINENVTLNISYPPRVQLKAVPSAVVNEGSSVTLVCKYESNPESNIFKWTNNGIPYQTELTRPNIIFPKINRDDAGSYTCTVCNELGQASASLQLIVLYAPNVSVSLLKNGSILCNATGVPNMYRFSRWEHLSEFGEHIRYLNGTAYGVLDIVSNSDSTPYLNNGKYVCTVQNGISDRFQKVNQSGYTFRQFHGRPFCLNTSVLVNIERQQEGIFIKMSVTAVSVPMYDTAKWLNGIHIIQPSDMRYTTSFTNTIILTEMHGQLVHISSFLFTLSFTTNSHEDFENYSIVISNKRGTALCRVEEQLNRNVVIKECDKDYDNSVRKEHLYYGIILLCFLAIAGWIAYLINYMKRYHIGTDITTGSVQPQSQELQIVSNFYDEIVDSEVLNQPDIQPSLSGPTRHFSSRAESSSTSTYSRDRSSELSNASYISPYQQTLFNTSNTYTSITRSNEYFVVIDSEFEPVHPATLKRHTY